MVLPGALKTEYIKLDNMINLHERLSEISSGYGVTREVKNLLAPIGLRATPFFPNLRQESELGFDVIDQKCTAL